MMYECRLTQTRNLSENSWWNYLKTVQEPAKKNALESHLASWTVNYPVPTVLYVTAQDAPADEPDFYNQPEDDSQWYYG